MNDRKPRYAAPSGYGSGGEDGSYWSQTIS
jgi:hypothetical protein